MFLVSRHRFAVFNRALFCYKFDKFARSPRAQGIGELRGVSNLALFNPQTSGTDAWKLVKFTQISKTALQVRF